MKKIILPLFIILSLCAFNSGTTPFEGVWEYRGGLVNGHLDSASSAYKLQRTYNTTQYQALVLEKGEKPVVYEQGTYQLNADTCLETQTYCAQQSKLLGKTVKYNYIISNDTLKLIAKLPNGNLIEDHWVKVK